MIEIFHSAYAIRAIAADFEELHINWCVLQGNRSGGTETDERRSSGMATGSGARQSTSQNVQSKKNQVLCD